MLSTKDLLFKEQLAKKLIKNKIRYIEEGERFRKCKRSSS